MTTPERPSPPQRPASPPPQPQLYTDPTVLHAAADMFKRSGREIDSEVNGTSMGRTIPDRSHVRIRCGAAEWAPGTVIAFFSGARLVTHRVVGRGGGRRARRFWLTRGDGSAVCDPPVAADAVLGEVIAWKSGDAWESVPSPAPTSLVRRVVAKTSEIVTRVALEVHAGLARHVAVGLARFVRAARRMLPG